MTDLASYRSDPARFIEEVLHDPATREPFKLLPAEREFLRHAFTFDDDGRMVFPELVYSAPKKSGKTGFAALFTLTLILLYGGEYAEAVVAANSGDQAKERVFEAIRRIVECSPMLKPEAKITATTVAFANLGGAVVTAIPANYAGAAGGAQNIAVFDEAWGFVTEGARRLFDELIPPPTKKVACRLTVSYAGFEDQGHLLLELYRRGLQQPQIGKDLYAGSGLLMFWTNDPVADWQTPEWIEQSRASLRPAQFARLIENRWTSSTEGGFCEMTDWDACVDLDARPLVSNPELPIYVGLDASTRQDTTAVVAVHWDRRAQRMRLIAHRIWKPPINFAAVEDAILDLSKRFRLKAVSFDPYQLAAVAQRLARKGVKMEEFTATPASLAEASQQLLDLVKAKSLTVYPDDAIRRAVAGAAVKESTRGWYVCKSVRTSPVDVVVAMAMACLAAVKNTSSYDLNALSGWDGSKTAAENENEHIKRWEQANYNTYVMSGGRRRLF
jgi:phage terminase large subunit-like protein